MPLAMLSACAALAMVVSATRPPQTTAPVIAVTIDVVVVDAAGRPVTRLGADYFSVELDGQRRPIVTMTYLPGGAPMAGAIGPVFDAVTGAAPVYRLVVRPPDDTAAGRDFTVSVRVDSPGVKVQAPQRVAAAPVTVTGMPRTNSPAAAKSADERLREAIATGRPERGIPIQLVHAVRRSTDSAKLRLDVRYDFPATQEKSPLSVLFGVVEGNGKVSAGTLPVLPGGDNTGRVDVRLLVEPGVYRLRFAVVDADGALGVIESSVNVQLHAMGSLLASDLTRWGDNSDQLQRPLLPFEITASEPGIEVSLELYPAGPSLPADVLVKMELAGTERVIEPQAGDGRLSALAWFPLERIAAGSYTIRATVTSAGTVLGTVSRTLVKR